MDFEIKDNVLIKYCGKSGNVVIPDEVQRINYTAFSDCENLTDIQIKGSVFLDFKFPENDELDVQHINRILSAMKLTECTVENSNGYIETRRESDSKGNLLSVTYRYGFQDCTLKCTKGTGEAVVYAMETAAFEDKTNMDTDSFKEMWDCEHSDRVIRYMKYMTFEKKCAFVLLHHESQAKDSQAKESQAKRNDNYTTKPINQWNRDDVNDYLEDYDKGATIHPGYVFGQDWQRYV